MKALIHAGGLGKRLGLEDIPKPMYKIDGKPILEHNILLLKKHGIFDICITTHYKREIIEDYFGDGGKLGVKIQYSFEKELLGTSGALKNIEWFLDKNGSFLLLYGDNYTNINLKEMLSVHKVQNPIATIALFDPTKSTNSRIAGGVITMDKDNNLLSFIEGKGNKAAGYVNAGVYVLDYKIINIIPTTSPSDFGKDIFPKLIENAFPLKGYLTDSFVIAIDTKDALTIAEEALRQGKSK